jgi:hypothetical protein
MGPVNALTTERPNDRAAEAETVGALLLAYAHAAGLTVLAEGGRLVVRGPGGAGAVVAALGRQKGAVLAALASSVFRSFGRSVVGVVAEDGPTSCADCGGRSYGIAGFPPLCRRCLRERAGFPVEREETRKRPNAQTPGRACPCCGLRAWRERPGGGWVCGACFPLRPPTTFSLDAFPGRRAPAGGRAGGRRRR